MIIDLDYILENKTGPLTVNVPGYGILDGVLTVRTESQVLTVHKKDDWGEFVLAEDGESLDEHSFHLDSVQVKDKSDNIIAEW